MKNILVACIAAATIAGCAGTRFSWDAARSLKAGMTQQEVEDIMGRPYLVSSRPEGLVWVWSYANGMTGGSRSLSVVFKDGKLVTPPSIPDSF